MYIFYRKLAPISLVAFLSVGCSAAAANYSVSADSQVVLRNAKEKGAGSFGVGTVTHSGFPDVTDRRVSCRALSVGAPADRRTFSNYIRTALTDELRIAGMHSESTPTPIQVDVTKLELDSTGDSFWKISATFTIGAGGASYTSSVEHPFTSAFGAESACQNAAQAFPAAVQKLLNQFFLSKEFTYAASANKT